MSYATQTERFVLECLRAQSENDFALLKHNFLKHETSIDWPDIVRLSAKLLPTLSVRIIQYCKDFPFSEEIAGQMKLNYLLTAQQNEKIKSAVEEIEEACKKENIEIIILKGAALLATVYRDDEALRPMDDVDILIRKKSLSILEDVLLRLGYQENYRLLSQQCNTDVSRDFFLQRHFHLVYFKNTVRLEVHWDISYTQNSDMVELLWEARESKTLGETPITLLNGEGNIYLACLNFDKDFPSLFTPGWLQVDSKRKQAFYYILFFLNELKKIIEYYKDTIQWDNLYRYAKTSQKEYEIFTALILAQKILGANIPAIAFKRIRYAMQFRLFALCASLQNADQVCVLMDLRKIAYAEYIRMRRNPKRAIIMLYSGLLYLFNKHNRIMYYILQVSGHNTRIAARRFRKVFRYLCGKNFFL